MEQSCEPIIPVQKRVTVVVDGSFRNQLVGKASRGWILGSAWQTCQPCQRNRQRRDIAFESNVNVHCPEQHCEIGVEGGVVGDFHVSFYPVGEGSGGEHKDHEPGKEVVSWKTFDT